MFITVYPMDKKSKAGDALRMFTNKVGFMGDLMFNSSKKQNRKGTKFMNQFRKNDIHHHTIEPERHNQTQWNA